MIQSPKNLTEQLLNLCERIAVEMRALFNTVDTKLGKTEKAASAKTADTATASVTATKATQDASGNIITSTYATKNEVTQGLAGKADTTYVIAELAKKQAKGDYATNTDLTQGLAGKANSSHTHTVSQITDMPKVVLSVNDITPTSGGNVNLGLHAVATSGDYNDLMNKPSMPTTPNAYVTDIWKSGYNWYRKWSDGFIEQGGKTTESLSRHTVTLQTPYTSTNYTVVVSPSYIGSTDIPIIVVNNVKSASFVIDFLSDSRVTGTCYWYTAGY